MKWMWMKLVELKPPRLSITHWAILSSWHLCLPVNLTLSPLPLGPQTLMRCHRTTPLCLQLLWIEFEQWLWLTAWSSAVHITSWVKGTSEAGQCRQPCLHLLSYWILPLLSEGCIFFSLSHLVLASHCYFKIIFFPLLKSPGLVTTPSLLLVTINYQLLRVLLLQGWL